MVCWFYQCVKNFAPAWYGFTFVFLLIFYFILFFIFIVKSEMNGGDSLKMSRRFKPFQFCKWKPKVKNATKQNYVSLMP